MAITVRITTTRVEGLGGRTIVDVVKQIEYEYDVEAVKVLLGGEEVYRNSEDTLEDGAELEIIDKVAEE